MSRRVRIIVSVFFGLSAIALCVVWVRSYAWRDPIVIFTSPGRWIHVESMHGRVSLAFAQDISVSNRAGDPTLGRALFVESNRSEWIQAKHRPPIWNSLAPEWHQFDDGVMVVIPYWMLVLGSGAISFATAVWRATGRFSLRTLLIATTLVAFALGTLMWAARRDFPVGSPRWWKKHRSQAVFHPGKGYRVPGVDGYFDGEGQPLESKSP